MAKKSFRLVSAALALLMAASTAASSVSASAEELVEKKHELISSSAAADGHTTEALGLNYATNPNGQVGARKTITVDGSPSDWDSSLLIAQGVANDDPRVYRPGSMYEIPVDDYALYAAWDDSNLYLMWEMTNVQDIVAPGDDFPITQGNLWISNLPVFLALNTGTNAKGDGTDAAGGTIWDSGLTFDTYVDTLIAFSTNASNGPFIYKTGSDGKFDFEAPAYKMTATGIQLKYGNGILSSKVIGIDGGYGENHNRVPGDTLKESSEWVDFNALGHKSATIDMCYELSIPLENLGLTASSLEENGIGVMKISTMGTSGMDCLPYDPSMSDNAALPYSKQEPNSQEKEDKDHITVPFANVGKAEISRPSDTDVKPSDTKSDSDTKTETETQKDSETDTSSIDSEIDLGIGETVVKADAKKGDTVEVTLGVSGRSNLMGISNSFTYDSSKYEFVSAESLNDAVLYNQSTGEIRWNGNFVDGSKGADFSKSTDLIKLKFLALSDNSGEVGTNKVRDCYDYDFKSLNYDCVEATVNVTETPDEDSTISIKKDVKKGDKVVVTFSADMTNIEGIANTLTYDTSKFKLNSAEGDSKVYPVSNDEKGTVKWDVMNSGDASGKLDVMKFTFEALSDNSGEVCSNTVRDIYGFDGSSLKASALSADAEVISDSDDTDTAVESDTDTTTDTTTDSEPESESDSDSDINAGNDNRKINVSAKAGDKVTVYFKAKDAKNALGIHELVDFDASALKYNDDAATTLGNLAADASNGRVSWNILFDIDKNTKGIDLTKETDVAVMSFTALKDISANDYVLSFYVEDFYDYDDNPFKYSTTTSAIAETESDANDVKKVEVAAKAGDTVTVYCRAKDAAKALGIQETLNYDASALEYVSKTDGEGTIDVYTESGLVRWSSMFDARGTDIIAEKDIVTFTFKALKDISSSDDVLSYFVEEFYDFALDDYDFDSTASVVAVTTSNTTDSEKPVVTDSDTTDSEEPVVTDSDTTDSDKPIVTDSDTTDSETLVVTDSDTTDSETPVVTDSDTTDSETPAVTDSDTTDSETPAVTDSDTTDSETPAVTDSDTTDSEKPVVTDSDVSDTDNSDTDNSDTDSSDSEAPEVLFGDVDDDDEITSNDAIMVLRASLFGNFDEYTIGIADVDGDGDITSNDAVEILRASIGKQGSSLAGKRGPHPNPYAPRQPR